MNLFERMLDEVYSCTGDTYTPRANVIEDDKGYSVALELAGVKKDDVNVEFVDGVLKVSGEKKKSFEKKEGLYSRIENYYGKFERSFLFDEILADKITAEFKEGVLNIIIPKDEEKIEAKKIPVN